MPVWNPGWQEHPRASREQIPESQENRMAEQAPRSIANVVFSLLLAITFAGAVWATIEMGRDVLLGPG